MVVEDDDEIRHALTELLESWELVPLAFNGGEAALQMLRGGCQPCVILLDLKLSGLSGWDFRRAHMNDRHMSEIPVVVMTALIPPEGTAKAELGNVLWLPKPFSPDHLREALSPALQSTR